MTIDVQTVLDNISPLVEQLEGPYKWYVMVGAAVALTALITRFIFKTFKWILLLGLVAALIYGGFSFLVYLSTAS